MTQYSGSNRNGPPTVSGKFTFPRGFMWGTASAAHQVEGHAAHSDWANWEKQPNRIRGGGTAAIACDWWSGRWREDFDRAADDGQSTHRMGIDWSRIEPRYAIWDEDALDHYRQMVKGLRERGLSPMVTLHHFTNPVWIAEKGGWENTATVAHFERFVRKVVKALGEYVNVWCTINEMNVYSYNSYGEGFWPPGKKNIGLVFTSIRNMLLGHAAAYRAIHQLQPEAQVGIAHNALLFDPARPDFALDRWVANFQARTYNDAIPQALHTGKLLFPIGKYKETLPGVAGTMDYFGVNYYTRRMSAFDLSQVGTLFGRTFHQPDAELDNMGLNQLYPEGLYRVIKWANGFGKPIIITENGWGDSDESKRIRAMLWHVRHLWQAINFNWPVKAYYYWTLVDNFEWERGWEQHFGLYALDLQTQQRTPRPAANLFAEICKSNSLSSDMVWRYAPEEYGKLFPG